MKTLKQIKNSGGIVRKFGGWSIVLNDSGSLVCKNTDIGQHSIVLHDTKNPWASPWTTDRPESLPKSVCDFLTDNGVTLYEYQYHIRVEAEA